jgi:predicted polyphosphate/ATP-dependent NAD kinase
MESSMRPVGVIPNPASGKDIRRLVAFGSVFDNHEKVNIVRRAILGLDAMGVEEVVFMPDPFGIGSRALNDFDVSLKAWFLDMPVQGTQEDSTRAAEMFRKMGVSCIITLGGDGTNRAVAKTCGDTPLLPISTGTNNVFPFMVEGTLAGIAAGVVALETVPTEQLTKRSPRLEVMDGGRVIDIALVDVVVSEPGFIGSRAVWDVSTLREIFLSRAEAGTIGFSSVGAHLGVLQADGPKGVHMRIGSGGQRVKAPIAPGLIRVVPVASQRIFESGEAVPISSPPVLLAMDGERERVVKMGEQLAIRINPKGPRVVDIGVTLRLASEKGLFVEIDSSGLHAS